MGFRSGWRDVADTRYLEAHVVTDLDPTGTTSASAAIQAAIDAVATEGGGVVAITDPGTYLLGLRYMTGYTDLMAAIWLRSNVHLLCAPGVVFKVPDSVTLLAGATLANQRAHVVTVIDPYAVAGVHQVKRNIRLTGVELDCNAAGQSAQSLYAGIFLGSVDGAWVTDCVVRDLYGTGAGPPGETMCYDVRSSRGVHFTGCVAHGGGDPETSSGFAANYSHDVTFADCTAHDLAHGQGFTVWQCAAVSYSGCHAYRCPEAAGFNCERSEGITYEGCVAGGRSPSTDGETDLPAAWFATNQAELGNYYGFHVHGGVGVEATNCVASYNQFGVYVNANTGIAPTLASDRVCFTGDFAHNPSGNQAVDGESVRTWIGPHTLVDAFAADAYHRSNAPHELFHAGNFSSGLRHTIRGVLTYVYRLYAETTEVLRVTGGAGTNDPGDSDTTDRPGDAEFFYNLKAATLATTVVSGAGKTTVADTDFHHRPGNGAKATALDTTTGIAHLCERVSGAWAVIGTTAPSRSVSHVNADTVVNNTTTETTLATVPLPATVGAGDVLHFTVLGDLINNSGGSNGYTFRLKLGATTLLTGKGTYGNSANRLGFRVAGEVLVITPASAQRVGATVWSGASSVNNWQVGGSIGVGQAAATEDLTATKSLVLTVQMDSANALSEVAVRAWALEVSKR